jgi:aquaporin Z
VFPARWVLPYWVAQFAGTIGAALFLQLMFTNVSQGGNYPIDKPGGDWRSFVMETVLTAILVSIILNTATGSRSIGHNAAIAVGSTVALLGLFASPISGASMNPARTLGPDIVGNDYTGWWVYVAGPMLGAAIAVAVITAVRGLPSKDEREAAEGGALPIISGRAGKTS